MTGMALPELEHQALAYGAAAFFPKPLDFPGLLKVLERELSDRPKPVDEERPPVRPVTVQE